MGWEGGRGWPGEAPHPLLPWQYFIGRLEDAKNISQLGNQSTGAALSHSYLHSMFDNFMTLCAMVPLLVFMCLNSFIHQR